MLLVLFIKMHPTHKTLMLCHNGCLRFAFDYDLILLAGSRDKNGNYTFPGPRTVGDEYIARL